MGVALVIFIFGLIILGLSGIRFVPETERWVVEIFGKYLRTFRPGLNWYLPGIMRIRTKIDIRSIKIPLFETMVKIDFKDGSAVPKGAAAIVRVKDPDKPYGPAGRLGREMTGIERIIYEVENWKELVRDLLENTFRSYFSTLTINEGMNEAKAGYEWKNKLPENERDRLEETLASWGLELMQATVMDFDLEPEIVRARGQIHIEERRAEASKAIARRQAIEWIKVILEMMAQARGKKVEEIEVEIDANLDLRREFLDYAKELNLRLEEAERGAFLDIRTQNPLADLIALWQRMPMGRPEGGPENKGRESIMLKETSSKTPIGETLRRAREDEIRRLEEEIAKESDKMKKRNLEYRLRRIKESI